MYKLHIKNKRNDVDRSQMKNERKKIQYKISLHKGIRQLQRKTNTLRRFIKYINTKNTKARFIYTSTTFFAIGKQASTL